MNNMDKTLLKEMRVHLGELHQKWRDEVNAGGDGHCKSNEGYVGLLYRLPNWHECATKEEYVNAQPKLSMVEVYSYLFGPNRLHTFETIEAAHLEVMSW
jgi:hypothetical protein